jgi:hypothetical protein
VLNQGLDVLALLLAHHADRMSAVYRAQLEELREAP